MPMHRCPDCGTTHYIREVVVLCECGHERSSHNDDGGRRKRAYCTVWQGTPGKVLAALKQCPCPEWRPANSLTKPATGPADENASPADVITPPRSVIHTTGA